MKIGFPVRLGAPGDDGRDGNYIGLPALKAHPAAGQLTDVADLPCPFCKGTLYIVPNQIVIGRIVGVEDGRIAVDPLPSDRQAVGCVPCGVTLYEPRG